jgi:serine/threonine protein kinase/Flp pilus assembly protein TadD
MSISQAEIDFGKVAISRHLATQDQIRECVAIQQRMPQPLHLGAILVKKGYMREGDARALLAEINSSPASTNVQASGYGSASGSRYGTPAAAPATQRAAVATPPRNESAILAVCSACGARFPVAPNQAGQRFRCRACGATITAPGAPAASSPSAFAPPSAGNGSAFFRAQQQSGGMHGTQIVSPSQIQPGFGPGSNYGGVNVGRSEELDDTKGSRDLVDSRPSNPVAKDFGQPGLPPSNGEQIASNLAADDPIAHVMETRRGADGNTVTVFGPYDILGEVARGGMGIVYRALQRDLKRIVALKVMKEGEGASKKQIKRFQRETETAAKLQHPNVVAVHEVGCHQGFHYFTMDLIEGDALDQVVKRGEKMPLERVLQIVEEVARAVHYAHGKGIIHRDLKPANILLDTDGHPKVTDFGLAKSIDHKSMLTRTGAVVGTPFYMPPEQAKGDNDIDQRADVYALGVILYELLTLKLPFHGETTMEVYRKILEEDPLPPKHHDPRIPPDIQTICLKAMDREPARRYQSAKDLADDVQRFLQGEPILARPLNVFQKVWRRAKKNMPVVVVGAVTCFALVLSLGVIFWKHQRYNKQQKDLATEREWSSFTTEFENQKINVKSQISAAIAHMKDHDPNGALGDLKEGVRILDDLPKLSQDFKWNPREKASQFLDGQKKDLAAVYRDAWKQTGDAWQMRESPDAFDEALKAYGHALDHDPESKEALDVHLAIARVLARMGRFEDALKTLASVLDKEPGNEKALLQRGQVWDLRQEHLKAIEDYTKVIDKELESAEAYLLRGRSFFELHQYSKAKEDFEKVLERKDSDWQAYIERGRVKAALGDWSGAAEDLTEAIDLQPSFPDGYYYRAEIYFAQRKHAEAIKDYEVAITRSAQFYKAYIGLGRVLEWTLDYDRAASQYEEVLRGDDREAEQMRPVALAAKAHLLALRADPLEVLAESEQKLREGGTDKGGPLGPPPALKDLNQKAESERKKREADAKDGFDKALAAAPHLVPALVGRARLALAQRDTAGARKDLAEAGSALGERPWIKEKTSEGGSDPDLAEVEALLGHAAVLEKSWDEASKHFEAARAADPESAFAVAGLGMVANARGDASKARELFTKARELEGSGIDLTKLEEGAKQGGEELFFQQEGLKYAQNADRSKKPEYYIQARWSFSRALSHDPYHALALLERGRLASLWKAWDLALADAAHAIAVDPFLKDAYELRGFLYGRDLPEKKDEKLDRPVALRDRAAGIADFTKAIEVASGDKNPKESAALAHYGRSLARCGYYPPPENVEGMPAELAKDDPADLDAANQDVQEAVVAIPQDLRAWIANEQTPTDRIRMAAEFHDLHARILTAMGKTDDAKAAKDAGDQVRKEARFVAGGDLDDSSHDRNPNSVHNAGKALRDKRNYTDAISKFDRAIALCPDLADAFYDRGTCYLKIGNFVPGILDFSRALELNPRFADQFYNKVYQVSYVVDLNRVITELNKIVADHPDVSYVIFLRGFFYVAKTEFKKYDKADLDNGIHDFDKTLQLNPKHVSAYIYRGFLFYKYALISQGAEKLRYFDLAMKNYSDACEKDPKSGIAHFLKAMVWSVRSEDTDIDDAERTKRIDQSVEELRISIEEKEFKGFDRIKNDKGFERVKNDPRVLKLIQGK